MSYVPRWLREYRKVPAHITVNVTNVDPKEVIAALAKYAAQGGKFRV